MRPKRQGLIVWYKHNKNIRTIRRYGHLIYASRRLKYAMIYVNQEDIEQIEGQLQKHRFVKKTERSYRPLIQTAFNKKKSNSKKEHPYTIGI